MTNRKKVLITGCSDGGIGSALAHAFHGHGFHVFASARNVSKMSSLVGKSEVTLIKLDVTSDEDVVAAAKLIREEFGGRLDFVVNNAGRNHFMPVLDESIDTVHQLFNTNVYGPLRIIKAFAPFVIAAKGTFVGITSISGHINIPWMSSYAASKRSMEIMAETLRLELEPFGVRVLSLVTGATVTNGLDQVSGFKLPSDSIYRSIEPIIEGRANGAGAPAKYETAEEYAAKVMPSILGDGAGLVWGPGFTTAFVKFTGWLPSWITDAMWRNDVGTNELAKQLKETSSAR